MDRRPLTRRLVDVRGFSTVELLVCMLILAIMAAIALPAWLDQRTKGQDGEAKLTLRTAVTALVTFESNESTFEATRAQLEAIEPSLGEARNLTLAATPATFTLTEDSAGGTRFTLTRDANGIIVRDCNNPGYGLCRANRDANLNRW